MQVLAVNNDFEIDLLLNQTENIKKQYRYDFFRINRLIMWIMPITKIDALPLGYNCPTCTPLPTSTHKSRKSCEITKTPKKKKGITK
jgi:hypothetical protein